jgi:hypothetical protein
MTDLDTLDPLGNDWKARGERGTARIRERAVLRDAGELVPVEGIEAVLVSLAGTVQGILAGITDAARAAGASADLMARLSEIITEAQLQVSLAMDGAVDGAVQAVDEVEGLLLEGVEDAVPAGPKERRERTREGKKARDTVATTRPRVKRA